MYILLDYSTVRLVQVCCGGGQDGRQIVEAGWALLSSFLLRLLLLVQQDVSSAESIIVSPSLRDGLLGYVA